MSDDDPSTPDASLDDLAMRHAFGTLSETEREQFEKCMGCPLGRASTLASEYREVVALMTATAAPSCGPPPPDVKAGIFEAIAKGNRPPLLTAPEAKTSLPLFIGVGDRPWTPTPHRGVKLRELSSASPEYSIVMVSLEPGAVYPHHEHRGSEDIYLLTGDASMDGRVMHAGDFMHWEPGSTHCDMTSPSGCQVLVVTSRKNYSPRVVHAYNVVRRVVSKVGQAFGVKIDA